MLESVFSATAWSSAASYLLERAASKKQFRIIGGLIAAVKAGRSTRELSPHHRVLIAHLPRGRRFLHGRFRALADNRHATVEFERKWKGTWIVRAWLSIVPLFFQKLRLQEDTVA
tara:strand:- start:519 stop:863 length:345 start_codon:yes stop_codon:yes gene_type:complete